EGWLALWYRPLWLSVLGAAGYVLALWLVKPYWRVGLLLWAWKVIAFAPMALLPPYPHYAYFSEVGSCMLGGLILTAALSRAGVARLEAPAEKR
ncbi:MAG: hypothetical protein HY321_20735, partial [Armatimonadetes bacterium]|nr:hypothetical protein [Armatimonadota bacterium]